MKVEEEEVAVQNGERSDGHEEVEVLRPCLSLLASKERDFLLSPDGTQVKVSDLDGKIIGLYFSANWYPPCRSFTTVLSEAYQQLKSTDSSFEIVFVSSDEDADAFNAYYSPMPWLAIPYSDLDAKKSLNRRFEIEGIPCLIILQPDNDKDYRGTLHDGVELIYRYGAQAFPFTQEKLEELKERDREKYENQTVMSLLTNHDREYLLARHGTNQSQVSVSSLTGKTIGLFFSAQWCLPCLNFTPKLISTYQKIKEIVAGKRDEDFEIVFVSSDRNQIAFDSYIDTMPFLALPFADPTIKTLAKHFDIREIPCLVILGPEGKIVTKNGINLVNLYRENGYPFTEARVEVLERKMDEEAQRLPRSVLHVGHRHELVLVSEGSGGGPFICCDCDEQGCGWAYQCIGCGYEVHTKCVRTVVPDQGSIA